jgi:hypothetical protein
MACAIGVVLINFLRTLMEWAHWKTYGTTTKQFSINLVKRRFIVNWNYHQDYVYMIYMVYSCHGASSSKKLGSFSRRFTGNLVLGERPAHRLTGYTSHTRTSRTCCGCHRGGAGVPG